MLFFCFFAEATEREEPAAVALGRLGGLKGGCLNQAGGEMRILEARMSHEKSIVGFTWSDGVPLHGTAPVFISNGFTTVPSSAAPVSICNWLTFNPRSHCSRRWQIAPNGSSVPSRAVAHSTIPRSAIDLHFESRFASMEHRLAEPTIEPKLNLP